MLSLYEQQQHMLANLSNFIGKRCKNDKIDGFEKAIRLHELISFLFFIFSFTTICKAAAAKEE